jgi:hypothetical protein
VESVGIVLHESDESITVAGHWNHGDPDNDEEITSVSGDMHRLDENAGVRAMSIQIRDVPAKLVKRQPKNYRAVHEAADKIELRMARSFLRAVGRLRASISISELTVGLGVRDAKLALRVLADDRIKQALAPVGTIARDAVLKGGRIGAERVREGAGG